MPRLAAEFALSHAKVPPYLRWSGYEAKRFCWAHDVDVVHLFKLKRDMPGDAYWRMASAPWEAQTITYPDGGSIIIVKNHQPEPRFIFTLVHEMGHKMLGHRGDRLNLGTGEYTESPRWSEDEANRFARNVLLPADEMRAFQSNRVSVKDIAERKGVSFSATMIRFRAMHEDGEFEDWTALA